MKPFRSWCLPALLACAAVCQAQTEQQMIDEDKAYQEQQTLAQLRGVWVVFPSVRIESPIDEADLQGIADMKTLQEAAELRFRKAGIKLFTETQWFLNLQKGKTSTGYALPEHVFLKVWVRIVKSPTAPVYAVSFQANSTTVVTDLRSDTAITGNIWDEASLLVLENADVEKGIKEEVDRLVASFIAIYRKANPKK